MKYNIGIDLGGTNIKVGLVDENYNIVAKATCKTDLPRPAEEIADSIAETVWKALNEAKVTIDELNSIGIGTPGTASRNTGVVQPGIPQHRPARAGRRTPGQGSLCRERRQRSGIRRSTRRRRQGL